MILDAFGRPVRPPRTFVTPDWLVRDTLAMFARHAADVRVMDLRASVETGERAHEGARVAVREPLAFHPRAFSMVMEGL